MYLQEQGFVRPDLVGHNSASSRSEIAVPPAGITVDFGWCPSAHVLTLCQTPARRTQSDVCVS